MIITIKNADFSTKNIGTLSTWTILTNLGSGATYSGNRTVDKGGSLSATITIAEGYELGSAGVSVIMGTTDITSSAATVNGNTITISIAAVTGHVTIGVPTLNTDGEEIPNYTFTINPTPSNATVTLTASGHTQNGNSITVPNGTAVSWSVSADGYTTRTGNWTINGGNKTENITLVATSGGSEDTPYPHAFDESIMNDVVNNACLIIPKHELTVGAEYTKITMSVQTSNASETTKGWEVLVGTLSSDKKTFTVVSSQIVVPEFSADKRLVTVDLATPIVASAEQYVGVRSMSTYNIWYGNTALGTEGIYYKVISGTRTQMVVGETHDVGGLGAWVCPFALK